jgi:ankyrin repeat protein
VATDAKPHRAHLYLIEVVIIVALLGGAGFLLVRNMKQAKHRIQVQQITQAIDEYATHTGISNVGWHEDQTNKIWELVKTHPNLIDVRGKTGTTPLIVAVLEDNRDMAQWLLDHNADIKAQVGMDWTPLHAAAANGRKEIAELLLAKGADVNAKTDKGVTPMDLAKKHKKEVLIDLLRAHGAKE